MSLKLFTRLKTFYLMDARVTGYHMLSFATLWYWTNIHTINYTIFVLCKKEHTGMIVTCTYKNIDTHWFLKKIIDDWIRDVYCTINNNINVLPIREFNILLL